MRCFYLVHEPLFLRRNKLAHNLGILLIIAKYSPIKSPLLFQIESEISSTSEEEEEADCYKQLLSNLGGGGASRFKCRCFNTRGK